jgi:hypothetical protein
LGKLYSVEGYKREVEVMGMSHPDPRSEDKNLGTGKVTPEP